jgi:hypothetical protein
MGFERLKKMKGLKPFGPKKHSDEDANKLPTGSAASLSRQSRSKYDPLKSGAERSPSVSGLNADTSNKTLILGRLAQIAMQCRRDFPVRLSRRGPRIAAAAIVLAATKSVSGTPAAWIYYVCRKIRLVLLQLARGVQ